VKKNRRQEVAFFAKNGQDKNVITTASGLQYTIIRYVDLLDIQK
jgi:FKBP-type peptidyl-prolyl cis-trans isomerase